MSNLQKIREACIKANSEIVELKFGCEVVRKSGTDAVGRKARSEGKEGIIVSMYENFVGVLWYGNENISQEFSENLEIIGRPIHLADVLLAIAHSIPAPIEITEFQVGDRFKEFDDKVWSVVKRWEWKDDNLENQSEPTKQFIADLL